MIRACDMCLNPYEARRVSSRYCGSTCRSRAARRRAAGEVVAAMPREVPGAVTVATRAYLEARGLAGTVSGAVAVALAGRLDVAFARGESGSSLAALAREFRTTVRGLGAGPVAADPLDQLRARRAARLRARPPSPPAC